MSLPPRVMNGMPESRQSNSASAPTASNARFTAAFNPSGVCCGLNRKLNEHSHAPGITLPAPVPALMFDTWKLVGGKSPSPSSHVVSTSVPNARAAEWIGFTAWSG